MDEESALAIISKFLPKEWAKSTRDDVSLIKITCGYLNSVWIVENQSALVEPRKVILRKYGGSTLSDFMKKRNDDEKYLKNTETDEVLIFYENSRTGWGPKLYGVFEGGRVEEYIDSHTLSPEEAITPEILEAIAIAYARHSTLGNRLPIPRDKLTVRRAIGRRIAATWKQDVQEQKLEVEAVFEDAGVDLEKCLTRVDYAKEYDWLYAIAERTPLKMGLVNMDANYLNVLVRNNMKKGENPVVLIDYEMAYYGPRAFDIASHWFCRMITWNDKGNKVNGHKFPSEKERTNFIRHYLNELRRLDPENFNSDGLDTEYAVMRDADIGVLTACLSTSVALMSKSPKLKSEPSFVTIVPLLQELFLKHKQECLKKYPDWYTEHVKL